MDGTDKRPLLIIGKAKQPCCFRGISSLPLPYTFNKNSWMTGPIFRDWLQELPVYLLDKIIPLKSEIKPMLCRPYIPVFLLKKLTW